jgi:alcohol dehydrogenase, propanol-preferring
MPNRTTMQAAVVEKFVPPLVIREVPIPTPGPGQALVQVFATGVCHTDLHAVDGDGPAVRPKTPRHHRVISELSRYGEETDALRICALC